MFLNFSKIKELGVTFHVLPKVVYSISKLFLNYFQKQPPVMFFKKRCLINLQVFEVAGTGVFL